MPKVSGKMNERERAICMRVRQFRESIKWPQPAFAHELGITRDQLASIEYGRTPLRFGVAYRFCWLFNVNQEWLATGNGMVTPFTFGGEFPTPGQLPDMLFTEIYDSGFEASSKLASEVERYTKSAAGRERKKPTQPPPNFDPATSVMECILEALNPKNFENELDRCGFAGEIKRLLTILLLKYSRKKVRRRIRTEGANKLRSRAWVDMSKLEPKRAKRVMELTNKIHQFQAELSALRGEWDE